MLIRQETCEDYGEVYAVVKTAFATAEHNDGTEHELVTALRKSSAFVPELSLVAETGGKIVGHILFTEAGIGNQTGLVLAPLAVLPSEQKQGVGAALIREGHRIAAELGYSYCSVLGSETYYPRFGYLPAEMLGIDVPDGIPSANFMLIKLNPDAAPVCGAVQYAQEFGI